MNAIAVIVTSSAAKRASHKSRVTPPKMATATWRAGTTHEPLRTPWLMNPIDAEDDVLLPIRSDAGRMGGWLAGMIAISLEEKIAGSGAAGGTGRSRSTGSRSR